MASEQFNTVRNAADELREIVNANSKAKHRTLSKVFAELEPDSRPYKIVQGVFRQLEVTQDAALDFVDELESDALERIENIKLNATLVAQANAEAKGATGALNKLRTG